MLVNSLPKMARSIKAGPCNQPSKAISYAINDGVICNFKNYVKVSSPTVLKGYEIIRSYSGVQCSPFIQSMFINLLQCASPAAGSWTAMKEKKNLLAWSPHQWWRLQQIRVQLWKPGRKCTPGVIPCRLDSHTGNSPDIQNCQGNWQDDQFMPVC